MLRKDGEVARQGAKRMLLGHPKVDRLLEALRHGDFIQEACAYATIGETTYFRWMQEGATLREAADNGKELTTEETQIVELANTLREAELTGQHAALAVIQRAAREGTWQAAAWFLERRNKKWSNRTEITGPDGGPVQTVTVDDVDEKIRNLISASEADRGVAESPTVPAG